MKVFQCAVPLFLLVSCTTVPTVDPQLAAMTEKNQKQNIAYIAQKVKEIKVNATTKTQLVQLMAGLPLAELSVNTPHHNNKCGSPYTHMTYYGTDKETMRSTTVTVYLNSKDVVCEVSIAKT